MQLRRWFSQARRESETAVDFQRTTSHPTSIASHTPVTLQEMHAPYSSILHPNLRVGPIFGGIAMLAWRVRETRVPVSMKAIVMPSVAMSSGLRVFATPLARVLWTWAIATVFLFAWDMIVRWRWLMLQQFRAISSHAGV